MLDTGTGQTWYGVDALLELLGKKWHLIKKIGTVKPVNIVLKKVYRLISYNRKVIVAVSCGKGKIDCAPDINYFYRYLFIALCLIYNTLLLFPIQHMLFSSLPSFALSAAELQLAHGLLVLTNILLALTMKKEVAAAYLGQVSMLALESILLLTPLLLLYRFIALPGLACWIYLLIVSILVGREYIRRMQYANLLQTNTWIAGINLVSMAGFAFLVIKGH